MAKKFKSRYRLYLDDPQNLPIVTTIEDVVGEVVFMSLNLEGSRNTPELKEVYLTVTFFCMVGAVTSPTVSTPTAFTSTPVPSMIVTLPTLPETSSPVAGV